MRLGARMRVCAAIAALAAGGLPGPAPAQDGSRQIQLNTDFGPLILRVDRDAGVLEGDYPKYQGHVFGRLADDGRSMRGIWTQAKGDQACKTARYGTTTWGHFVFSYSGKPRAGTQMAGSWGYCDEDTNRPWNGTVLN